MKIAGQPVVALVGDTLFAHGGVLMQHVRFGLPKLNRLAAAWIRGARKTLPPIVNGQDSPVWTRRYGDAVPGAAVCQELRAVLDASRAKRLVVGHTVQSRGITSGCDGALWRIDVGLSRYYGPGPTEILQVDDGVAKVLRKDEQD